MSDKNKIFEFIDKIKQDCMNDPDLYKQMESNQKKFGTLSEDDLRRQITI